MIAQLANTRITLLLLRAFLAGCAKVPRDAFRLPASTLAIREAQTREYNSVSDAQILSASAAVLQDMGYAIDEMEEPLGVTSASKRADAANTSKYLGLKTPNNPGSICNPQKLSTS